MRGDLAADLPKINIPVLVMHATAGRILPIEACCRLARKLIGNSKYIPIEGADHSLWWTLAEDVTRHLNRFFD